MTGKLACELRGSVLPPRLTLLISGDLNSGPHDCVLLTEPPTSHNSFKYVGTPGDCSVHARGMPVGTCVLDVIVPAPPTLCGYDFPSKHGRI